jgi:ribosomal protein L11 methylase PrmA
LRRQVIATDAAQRHLSHHLEGRDSVSDPLDLRTPSPAPPALAYDAGSFRDPAGRVFERDSRIFRTVEARLAEDFGWLWQSGVIADLIAGGQLVRTWEAEPSEAAISASTWKVLEAERIPFISYPYEWPFTALKAAALFHIDLHLALLARDASLVDASAYNVQFRGARPVFIDILSLRRYHEGEVWNAHRQFCEQFLNPLLLGSNFGIPHNAWYRGSVEGIPVREVAAMLKLRHKLKWNVLMHVVMPNRLQRMASNDRVEKRAATMQRRLPKQAFMALLSGLRKAIARLRPAGTGVSQWADYANQNTYSGAEATQKRAFVQDFVKATRASRIVDVGCNTGDYAVAALEAGASSVLGIESDAQTANLAFERAVGQTLDFLPLVVDAANPSPAQGRRSAERTELRGTCELRRRDRPRRRASPGHRTECSARPGGRLSGATGAARRRRVRAQGRPHHPTHAGVARRHLRAIHRREFRSPSREQSSHRSQGQRIVVGTHAVLVRSYRCMSAPFHPEGEWCRSVAAPRRVK